MSGCSTATRCSLPARTCRRPSSRCWPGPAPDRHGGISLILVPNTTEGVDVRKLDTIVRRSLGTTEIFFTDARVPKGNILGEPG